MTPLSKRMSLLAISAALMLSGGHVFAKSGGGSSGGGPSHVKTSGTSAAPSGSGGPVAHTARGCGHYTYGRCAPPPPMGTQSGNDPRGANRGPGNPTLHPK
jgi:hypothetical protein